jgi:hypothetical protein
MAGEFTRGKALRVAYDCTIDVTGSGRALSPGDTLVRYNVHTNEQLALIKKNIRTNKSFGLPAPNYDRRIKAAALKDLAIDWTLRQLGNLIFEQSTAQAS